MEEKMMNILLNIQEQVKDIPEIREIALYLRDKTIPDIQKSIKMLKQRDLTNITYAISNIVDKENYLIYANIEVCKD